MRHVLVDKQGNFGSIAGLPPAAMRYTEARMSSIAALMLDDLKLDTVDFVPTYDERHTEPTVLPSKFPNLLVNGANGIAVGMATSIPPHNLGEVCDSLVAADRRTRMSRSTSCWRSAPAPTFPPAASSAVAAAFAAAITPAAARWSCAPGPQIEEFGQEPLADRRLRDSLPAGSRPRGRADRGAGERRPHQGHLGHSQRKRPERARPVDPGAEARRRSRGRAQPALPVFAAARLVLDHLPGAGRRQAAHAVVQGAAGGVPPASADGHSPAHAVPVGPGPGTQAHGRRAAAGARQHRRDHPRHPLQRQPGRSQGPLDGHRGAGLDDAARPGRRGLRRLPVRARRERHLHADARAGRRHPADDAGPVGQPGAGKARRRVSASCSRKSPSTCGSSPTTRSSWA